MNVEGQCIIIASIVAKRLTGVRKAGTGRDRTSLSNNYNKSSVSPVSLAFVGEIFIASRAEHSR
jgi:hypothetical protein